VKFIEKKKIQIIKSNEKEEIDFFFSKKNSEFLSSSSSDPPEESLPFLMPKLRRAGTNNIDNNSVFSKPQVSGAGPVRQLSLTLPFPPLQSLPLVAPAVGFKDLVDDTIPLEIQR
jgi:hypothetical protein